MIRFPATTSDARGLDGEIRAGGTDLTERRHRGISAGPLVDLRDVENLDLIDQTEAGGLRIGAGVTVSQLARDPRVRDSYPGLAQAAAGLATPQIRARATVAGNLLQQVRCWYYRSPEFPCIKKGGTRCFAREGDHLYHVIDDRNGPCIAPHPSTLAVALMCFEATVQLAGGEVLDLPTLLGDGSAPAKTHDLPPGEVLVAVELPPPVPGEHSGYFRAIHRARAEWPLIEVTVRVVPGEDRIQPVRAIAGAVANRPVALSWTNEFNDINRLEVDRDGWPSAALPDSAYKAKLVDGTVRQAVAQAMAWPAAVALPEEAP